MTVNKSKYPYVPTDLLNELKSKYPMQKFKTISKEDLHRYQGAQEVIDLLENWKSKQDETRVLK